MMKHYNGVLESSPFSQAPRIGLGTNRCRRFRKFLPPERNGPWSYSGSPDCVNFTVNKPVEFLEM